MTREREWRCSRCGRRIGVIQGDRLHIRFARGHEYLVGFPATCVCRNCRTLNDIRDADSAVAVAALASSGQDDS